MRPKPFAIITVCACIERRLAAHDAVTGLVDPLVAARPIASFGSERHKALSCLPTSKCWFSPMANVLRKGPSVESGPHRCRGLINHLLKVCGSGSFTPEPVKQDASSAPFVTKQHS